MSNNTRARGRKGFWAGAGLCLGSIVVSLLCAEAIARLARVDVASGFRVTTVYPDPRHPGPERAEMGFIPYATVRSVYPSNPRGYFDGRNGIDHVHNSVGWRDVEHALEKPAGTYRILGLGDSYLWGQGVKQPDICLSKLGAILQKEAPPGVRIETINAGQSAMNTVDERNLLRARGLRYAPDLVILHFVPNDVEPDIYRKGPKVEFFTEYLASYIRPDWLSQRSRLWGWAKQRCLRSINGRAYLHRSLASFAEQGEKWSHCRDALDDIQAICRRSGAGLLVVIFPFFVDLDGDYPFQPIHDLVREHCREKGIPVLDLREAYRKFNGPELWVHPTDQHPSEIAHGIAAQTMAGYLEAHAQAIGLYQPHPQPAAASSP